MRHWSKTGIFDIYQLFVLCGGSVYEDHRKGRRTNGSCNFFFRIILLSAFFFFFFWVSTEIFLYNNIVPSENISDIVSRLKGRRSWKRDPTSHFRYFFLVTSSLNPCFEIFVPVTKLDWLYERKYLKDNFFAISFRGWQCYPNSFLRLRAPLWKTSLGPFIYSIIRKLII